MDIICRLMQTGLPDFIDPRQMTTAAERLQGKLVLGRMTRLTALLGSQTGTISVTLQGGIDDQGNRFLAGRAETETETVCQRCLQSFALPLTADFRLALIEHEAQVSELPEPYDPLIVTTDKLSLVELVEDELILAMPVAPRCTEPERCPHAPVAEPAPTETSKPFAGLDALLKDLKKQE